MKPPPKPRRRKTKPPLSSVIIESSPTYGYATAVVAGAIPACTWVVLACQRHLRDLKSGHLRGLHFDYEAEARILAFYEYLSHSKGEWAGKPLTPSPWQAFILGSVFGWKNQDGTRRFRTIYSEIPRKNGKSTLSGGVALYLLTADNEPGSEVYSVATKRDQARIVFDECKNMVASSPELRRRVRTFKLNMNVPATHSKYEPLGSDSETLDGLNVHGSIHDELHAWPSRDLYDVIETAIGARRQPLIWNITTAGKNASGICWETHEYAEKILHNLLEDDSFFAYIATIDKEDIARWDQPDVWAKANPNFNISVKQGDLNKLVTKARHMPRAKAAFLRLRLNVWTFGIDTWLPLEKWRQGNRPFDPKTLEGRACYAAIDLSSTTDLSALALVFPPDNMDQEEAMRAIARMDDVDGDTLDDDPQLPLVRPEDEWLVVWRFYMPADNLRDRAETDRASYDLWADQGYIIKTPGNVVDYDYIRQDVNELGTKVNIRQIAIDRWGATHMSTLLQKDGFNVLGFGQGFASMSAPSKFLEWLVYSATLNHGGNPVADWMSQNVVVAEDEARNIKPVKSKSTGRIDGIVALIMAIALALVPPEEDTSVPRIFVW